MQEDQDFKDFMKAINSIDDESIAHAKQSTESTNLYKKSKKEITYKVDLHRQTIAESRKIILNTLQKFPDSILNLNIVTGKGRHSGKDGGVLFKEIYKFVTDNFSIYILEIDDPPEQGMFKGLPLRGYFKVKLKLP